MTTKSSMTHNVNKYLNTCYCNFISNIVLGTCTDPGIKVLNKYNDEPIF